MVVGLYPGTFDPVTNGHMDIIKRATRLVDQLVIGVARNAGKNPFFSIDERVDLLAGEVASSGLQDKITVRAFDNLLVHFARDLGACVLIRGLRAVSDFEYEFQMAGMNAKMDPEIETVFLMASDKYQFVSSRFVKEIAALNGDIRPFVGAAIAQRLRRGQA